MPASHRRKLPTRVTLLLWLVLSLTAWNAVRFGTAIAHYNLLKEYVPRPGPAYIAMTGAVWTLVGLFLLLGIWRGYRWTRAALLTAAGLYTIWVWADRLLMQAPRPNWPFALAVTLILLTYTAAIVLDKRNVIFFQKEAYERKTEDQTSA